MLLALSAWIAGLLGLALALVLGFANGMKTVPSRSPTEVAIAAAFPALALLLAGFALHRAWRAHGADWSVMWQGVLPLCLALGALVIALDLPLGRRAGHARFTRETATRADGSKYYRDNEHNWRLEQENCRAALAREAAGELPPSGARGWPEFWADYFAGLEQWQENPGRYIGLVLQLRRDARLPEIPNRRA